MDVPRAIAIRLGVAIGVAFVTALIGLIVLWPAHANVSVPNGAALSTPTVNAAVLSVNNYGCRFSGQPLGGNRPAVRCETSQVRIASGPDKGQVESVDTNSGAGSAILHGGDKITVSTTLTPTGKIYEFVDFQRGRPLFLLALVFAVVVVAVARWRGIGALVGLGVTWLVLVRFAFPALLQGRDALSVAIVASAVIITVVLFIAHGVNSRTATAVIGTLTSLAVVGIVGVLAVNVAHLTGLASEENSYLQTITTIRLQGLVLAGMVIGSLGVLNDVTVTQASAVWEIHDANPARGAADVYRAGMRVGRDHIASTVYTLVLAYAGAALPLLLLFDLGHVGFNQVVTSEVVAEEVVRTLVGSLGLLACVPLTTVIAALVVTSRARSAPNEPQGA
ncbi:MAG: YibE/F family protein [Acidimicrobiales bacterium]